MGATLPLACSSFGAEGGAGESFALGWPTFKVFPLLM